ncbi:DUF2971 domain-containing protein [Seohaeicola nanhaiensis]|uniref:DUF2971 domain-containing protein n=2 Tax=Seohaeicola nanhaiensis TaxID=1387282 RepID=A0ABV9KCJ7_9RHOB
MDKKDLSRSVPDRLYKYRSDLSSFTLDVIDRSIRYGEVFFSKCSELNDPFDNLAAIEDSSIKDVLALQRKYFGTKPVISKRRFAELRGQPAKKKSELTALKPSVQMAKVEIYSVRKTLQLQKDNGAIACYSAKRCNLPMWAHYANAGKGLVLAYRYTEKFYKFLDTPVPFPVAYCDRRTKLTTLDVIHFSNQDKKTVEGGDSAANKCFKSIFFEKSSDWSYEDEWRFVLDRGDHGYRKVHCLELSEIIFGPFASCAFVQSVNEVVHGAVPLLRTALDKSEFDLFETPLGSN